MELKRIPHYVHRVYQLGLLQTVKMLHNRYKDKQFDKYWRKKAEQRTAHHCWIDVAKQLKIQNNFPEWHESIKKRISITPKDLQIPVSQEHLVQQADEFVNQCFDLLGSGKQSFREIPWHTDFRLQQSDSKADVAFDKNLYYKDFVIKPGISEQLVKDIKIPWELSRLQHFFVLGYAYQETDNNNYADAFKKQCNDWQAKNPFLLGSHWACPMDVGIRAVNLVWAYYFFKDSLPNAFWQKYSCLLYDHFFYLEHNWEVYDFRTSNHYLSDLIGYFYLCYFFYDQEIMHEKAAWCYQEFLKEFEKQVFFEGTDYEGSTYYHKLVTEIFFHFEYIAQKMGFVLPSSFKATLNKMFEFIRNCTPDNGTLVQIGDNDSGKILYFGITKDLIKYRTKNFIQPSIVHYKEFGLSILKKGDWHVTLRHHVYTNRQPSGHFHADVGSVTLAYQGIPIFVDPGSYLYTPSKIWRNRFRDSESHSTWYVQDHNLLPIDERLFLMNIPEQTFDDTWMNVENCLYTIHSLYEKSGITVHRHIAMADDAVSITINDWFDNNNADVQTCCWNFILDSGITPQLQDNAIVLYHEQKPILKITSSLSLNIEDCYVSCGYGNKQLSKKLKATKKIHAQEKIQTTITVL